MLLQVFISTECLWAEVTIENGWVGVVASANVLLHAVLQFETFAAVFTLEGEVRIRFLRSRRFWRSLSGLVTYSILLNLNFKIRSFILAYTQSRFASLVLDGVLGPPHLARLT